MRALLKDDDGNYRAINVVEIKYDEDDLELVIYNGDQANTCFCIKNVTSSGARMAIREIYTHDKVDLSTYKFYEADY